MSQVGRISWQLSPLMSSAKQVKITAHHPPQKEPGPDGVTETPPWLRLPRPFREVQDLTLRSTKTPGTHIAYVVEEITRKAAEKDALPALRFIEFCDLGVVHHCAPAHWSTLDCEPAPALMRLG